MCGAGVGDGVSLSIIQDAALDQPDGAAALPIVDPVASVIIDSAAFAVEDLGFKFLAQQQMDPSLVDQAFRGTYEVIEGDPETRFAEYGTRNYRCKAVVTAGVGSTVTVKRFRDTNMIAAMAELFALQRCAHPHIVRLIDVCSAGEAPRFVFTQFGKPVHEIKLKPVEVTDVSFQVLGAIQYLHSLSIAHLDIRVANVTLHQQPTGESPAAASSVHVVLIDLACSRLLRPGCQRPLEFGTRPEGSRAPEILLQGPVALKSDMWGVGVVLAHISLGRPVWSANSCRSILRCIHKALGQPTTCEISTLQSYPGWQPSWASECQTVEWSSQLGEQCSTLVMAMLRWTPLARLSASEALQHGFFTPRCPTGFADAKSGNVCTAGLEDAEPTEAETKSECKARFEVADPRRLRRSICFGSGSEVASQLKTQGFVILPALVAKGLCESLIQQIQARVAHFLSFYGDKLPYDETCSSLLLGGKLFASSPPGWTADAVEKPFGVCKNMAWVSAAGSGRLFEGGFSENPAAVAVQEAVRPLMAGIYSLAPDLLVRIPERVSVKPAGSKELRPHLDCNRQGSYQVVISLCQTEFMIFPGSQDVHLECRDMAKYHELSNEEMETLREAGVSQLAVAAGPGDVLVMQGGGVVHSSPAVASGHPTRYMAYAHYAPVS